MLVYVLSMAAFALQQQSWVVGTETIGTKKPKISTLWALDRKLATSGLELFSAVNKREALMSHLLRNMYLALPHGKEKLRSIDAVGTKPFSIYCE